MFERSELVCQVFWKFLFAVSDEAKQRCERTVNRGFGGFADSLGDRRGGAVSDRQRGSGSI
jgi:hypothetical protein